MANENDDFGPLAPGQTPRILREAIRVGLMSGPLNCVEDRMYWLVRDFLAQKFGVEMLKANPDMAEVLDRLFKLIVVDWKYYGGGVGGPK